MTRSIWLAAAVLLGAPPPLPAQDVQRTTWRRVTVHYGKWLTAGTAAAFTALAAREHQRSRHDWDALLAICRSADDACLLGADGR